MAAAVRGGVLCTFADGEHGSADLDRLLTSSDRQARPVLARVRDALGILAVAPAVDRPGVLEVLSESLATASRLAGRPAQVTVNEDYVLPPTTVDTRPWHEPLADLAAAVELLSVFDWLHDVRVMTAEAFVERFGAGAEVPLLEHADELVDEVSRRTVAALELTDDRDLAALRDAGRDLQRLYALRRRLLDETGLALTRGAATGEQHRRRRSSVRRSPSAGSTPIRP